MIIRSIGQYFAKRRQNEKTPYQFSSRRIIPRAIRMSPTVNAPLIFLAVMTESPELKLLVFAQHLGRGGLSFLAIFQGTPDEVPAQQDEDQGPKVVQETVGNDVLQQEQDSHN